MSNEVDRLKMLDGAAVRLAEQWASLKNDYEDKIMNLERQVQELQRTDPAPSIKIEAHAPEKRRKVVVLVHGIRDQALWQSELRASLRHSGMHVELTNYGRFSLLRFLIPLPMFRNSIVKNIRNQIRLVIQQNPKSDVSVIAHSFGTYVVSRVMDEELDIFLDRIVFCGAVNSNQIRFERFSNRFNPPVLNEIGTRDIWPALADSLTWGYGSPGTYGSRRPLFEDRWHKDAGHSYFLSKEFCTQYWVPFIKDGTVNTGEESPEKPHFIIRVFTALHLKYVVLALFTLILFYRFLW